MPFLAAGTTDTKFLGSTGVATANSTNKYQKYKSVELGDQLGLVTKKKGIIIVLISSLNPIKRNTCVLKAPKPQQKKANKLL